MKKVLVSKLVSKRVEGSARNQWVLEPAGEALFHQFGVSYEEFESGPGNYSTAIVEWPDGKLENVPVDHVQFVTPNA
jgi:hypothetical protein